MGVAAEDAERHRPAAEGRDVVDGVGAAAEPDVGAVVLEDEDGRLAADALDAAVEELVGHEVGEDEDAPPAEGADDGVEPARRGRAAAGRAPLRRHGASRDRIDSTASSRFSATRSGGRDHEGAWYSSSPRP